MNYSKIYVSLITKSKNRFFRGYTESHHIVPKCMGGTNDKHNLVDLTPEEHYVAHQLLVKIFPDEPGLVRAAIGMTASKKVRGYIGNKLYGWIKRKNSEQVSKRMIGNRHLFGHKHTEETKKKISIATKGVKKPESMRKKLSASVSGSNNPMFGKPRTLEQRIAQSKKMSGVNNKNADHRIHEFVKGNIVFIGKLFDFREKFNLEQSGIAHLMSGKYKMSYGWKYNGVVSDKLGVK